MIREDSISHGLSLAGGMIIIYLGTFIGLGSILLIPILLLILGMIFQIWVRRRFPPQDMDITGREYKQIGFFTVLSLAAIGLGSLISPQLFKPPLTVTLSIFDQFLYGQLYSLCEERFFRGFVTSFLLWKTNPMLAHLGSGAIFCVYHFKIYGTATHALVYVLIAGTVLSWVTWRTKRLSPAMLSHALNNALV